MKHLFIILCFLNLSCKKEPKTQKLNTDDIPTIIEEDKTNQRADTLVHLKEKIGESIYVGVLKKIYGAEDYYLSLYFKSSTPDSIHKKFHTSTNDYVGKLLSKTEDHERYKIETSIAEKYFNVNGLDTLIVFNNYQKVIDTLYRKNYEYFSNQIESEVIVTYKKTSIIHDDKDYICMSQTNIDFRKKNEFKKDDTYLKNTLVKNSFKPTSVHSHYKMLEKNDTISFMSFGIYSNETQKECFYLLKNKKPIDSIINEYSISKMVAVPIFMESENLYLSYEFIPDSGSFWTSLVGVDIKNNKLKRYPDNRLSKNKVKPKKEARTTYNQIKKATKNTYYVSAINGLSIRDKPSLKSNKIGLLEYLQPITVLQILDNKPQAITDDDNIVNGHWALIENGSKQTKSYVFNGFLKQNKQLEDLPPNPIKSEDLKINGVLPYKCRKNDFIKQLGTPDSIRGYRRGRHDGKTYREFNQEDSITYIYSYAEHEDDCRHWHFEDFDISIYYKNGITYEELNGDMFFVGINFSQHPENFILYKNYIWNNTTTFDEINFLFPKFKILANNDLVEFPRVIDGGTFWQMWFDDTKNIQAFDLYYYD